ncbi:MAG: arsenic metallochaperone ArsD family protein, partial [Alphaproteobacteria bacterium]
VNFAADLDWLKSVGIDVTRINISNEPMKFVENASVKSVLDSDGVDGLPVVLVDGETRSKGCFPDRTEMAGWVGVEVVTDAPKTSGGCCGGEEKEASSGCC